EPASRRQSLLPKTPVPPRTRTRNRDLAQPRLEFADRLGRRLGVGAAPADHDLVIDFSASAISAALATTAMPFSTGAPLMTNGVSRANSSIGRPPAGMMTSAPASIRGFTWATKPARTVA